MASIQLVVNATDAASGVFAKIAASADGLDKQLEDLGKRVADPEVSLQDSKFTLGMIRAAERLDKLNEQRADPKVEVDTAKAQVEILRINAMLDRLDAKKVDVTVGVDRSLRSRFGGLFGGAPEKALAGLAGITGGGGGGGGPGLSPFLWAGGGILAALLAPALLPTALGLGIGGGGAALGIGLGAKANKQIQQLAHQLQGITGNTPADKKKIAALTAQMAAIRQANAGPLGVFGAFQDLGHSALGVFSGALTGTGPGFSGGGPGGTRNASFLTGLTDILKQLSGFIKSIGPQLGDMFRASIPYLSMFVKLMEQSAKTLLPVFTQMLRQMTPYLPLIGKGLLIIVQGLAGFMKAIGPQAMQTSAKAFVILAEVLQKLFEWLGWYINRVGDKLPGYLHNVAVVFDTVRHAVATWAHAVASAFDTLKGALVDWWHFWVNTWHVIVAAASSAWGLIVKGVKDAIKQVIQFFTGLPSSAIRAMEGFGTSLYNFGRMALTKMWNGLKDVFGAVWSWFKSLPSKLLNAIGIHSPPDWAIEAGKHIMGGLLHGITSRKDELLSRMRSISTGAVGGALAGSPAAAARYARGILPAYGWGSQWAPLNAVAMRESGWSMTARNPSSGAYGIAQFINGPSEYYQYGGNPNTIAGQVIGFFNYIRQRYGNPSAAWQHELNFGWYDRGGWLPPGLSLALNQTGRPERVGGGGDTYNITVQVGPGTHPVAAAQAIAKLLNDGAKSGVKLRTSILGPG